MKYLNEIFQDIINYYIRAERLVIDRIEDRMGELSAWIWLRAPWNSINFEGVMRLFLAAI